MRSSLIRSTSSLTAGIAAALLMTGCTEEGGGDEPLAEIEAWALQGPEVRIGSVDDPEYAFDFVLGAAEGPGGRVYSLQANEAFVRRWTAEGEPDGRIGREGEGPGEFIGPRSLGFFGDTLWVMDSRANRVSYFGPDGGFLGSVTPHLDLGTAEQARQGTSPPRPEAPFRSGLWFGREIAFSRLVAEGTLEETFHATMDAAGEVLDTLWFQDHRPSDILALLRDQGGTYSMQPFGDGPLHVVDPEGGLVVLNRRVWGGEGVAAVTLTRIDARGDTVWSAPLSYEPRPLPESAVDSTVSFQAAELHGFMVQFRPDTELGVVERQYAQAMYVPDWLPAVREMVLGEDGSVWVKRQELDGTGDRWWVVSAGGELEREVVAPEGLQIRWVRGDRIWAHAQDELDVSYLVRYRAVPADS